MSDTFIHTLLADWDEERSLSREEAVAILDLPKEEMEDLISCAYALRTKYKGKKVSVQLLTNVRSGNCSQNCAYCAQSCESHAPIEKYRLVFHKIFQKKNTQICCSIGFLTEKQAKMLKEAGLDRINHNLNSSRSFYPEICSTHTYDQRVNNIKMLQGLGFEICSGGIIGMGESKEDVVDMLMDLKAISPESVPINFLLPIPGTRLADRDISGLTPEYCMKVLCLARLMIPKSDIRCAAGREVYFKGIEPELFKVVDSIFASGYLTAGGQGIDDTMKMIRDAGFTGEIESTDE